MIRETIVVTRGAEGRAHIAPMGISEQEGLVVIAPFRPSATLENLQREGCATLNYTDDVRIYAGCVTGRRDWPVQPADGVAGLRLAQCLAHAEVEVRRFEDDALRPRFFCRVVQERTHAPFQGFNRAQGAVIEAAILVSRLGRLAPEKIRAEIEYLSIAVDKTAGARELEAWQWLNAAIADYQARSAGGAS